MFGSIAVIISSRVYTVQIEAAKLLNSSYLEGYYNVSRLSVSKFNRSIIVVNFEIEFLTDFNEDYVFDIAFYTKRRAGMNWSKNLYYWPKLPLCYLLKELDLFTMEGYNNTNFPRYDKDVKQCVLPNVNRSFSETKFISFIFN